jgi:DNA-binding phage protein
MPNQVNIKYTKAKDPLAEDFAKSIASVESQVERRKLSIVEELLQFMKREGINRSELAERMGVGPSRITKMLSGDENLTIDTLVRAGRAVGADLVQTFVPKGQEGHWAAKPAAKQSTEKRASLQKTKA